MDKVLEIQDLVVRFYTYAGVVKALEEVSLDVKEEETFGIVGETGCGKSVTALSTMILTPAPGKIERGKILLKDEAGYTDLTKLDESELRDIRGGDISMVFQEPEDALNPVYTIGEQIAEAYRAHQKEELIREVLRDIEKEIENSNPLERIDLDLTRKIYNKMLDNSRSFLLKFLSKIPIVNRYEKRLEEVSERRAIKILDEVGIPNPEDVADKHPHEMSGGMNQRAVISMALAGKPKLLIADEPTSNLDVSIQARILEILNDLKEEYGLSIIYITHDLGVVAQTCDRAGVMYAGRIVEIAEIEELFENPQHPYTKLLLRAIPSPEKDRLESIEGSVPDLISPPSGCRFNPRCPEAKDICSSQVPELMEMKDGHYVACHLPKGEKNEDSA